jgi:hypothetical protein
MDETYRIYGREDKFLKYFGKKPERVRWKRCEKKWNSYEENYLFYRRAYPTIQQQSLVWTPKVAQQTSKRYSIWDLVSTSATSVTTAVASVAKSSRVSRSAALTLIDDILGAVLRKNPFQSACLERVRLKTDGYSFQNRRAFHRAGTMHRKAIVAPCCVLSAPGTNGLSRLLPERTTCPRKPSFIMSHHTLTFGVIDNVSEVADYQNFCIHICSRHQWIGMLSYHETHRIQKNPITFNFLQLSITKPVSTVTAVWFAMLSELKLGRKCKRPHNVMSCRLGIMQLSAVRIDLCLLRTNFDPRLDLKSLRFLI